MQWWEPSLALHSAWGNGAHCLPKEYVDLYRRKPILGFTFKLVSQFKPTLAILLAVTLAACSSDSGEGQSGPGARSGGPPSRDAYTGASGPRRPNPNVVPAVEVVAAQYGSLPLEERLTGRVIADNQTAIYPEVNGPIVEVLVNNGDQVEEGSPLVKIRDTEYREAYLQAESGLAIAAAQTRQARANLQLIQTQFKRTQELVTKRLETQAALDDMQAQVEVAEANVELRQAQEAQARSQMQERKLQLDNTIVRAPVSGWVGQRNAERGQQVSASSQLFIIGDLSNVEIEIPMTEKMLSYLQAGTPVEIRSDIWPDTVLTSTIARISPFLDANTLRTQGYVEMQNPQGLLRAGMFVSVDVLYGNTDQAVLIPNNAIYRHPRTGQEGVFVVEKPGSEFNPQAIDQEGAGPLLTTARSVSFKPLNIVAAGRMASGVRGVNEGDWIVVVGKELLANGRPEAKARLMSWDRMMDMQQAQSRDLFDVIDKRQAQKLEAR